MSDCILWALKDDDSRLQGAIRRHRDQRGDDRCWMDDEELYKELPEGYTPPVRDTAVELKNCERFIACRQNPATKYVSPQREIERLNAENARLRLQLSEAALEINCAGPVAHRIRILRKELSDRNESLSAQNDALIKYKDRCLDLIATKDLALDELIDWLYQLYLESSKASAAGRMRELALKARKARSGE